MVVKHSYEEIILLNMLNLNSLMPHYYSELILMAHQLLDMDERQQLNELIFEVEKLVLETEVIPRKLADGRMVWVERIKGELSLYDIEMAIESNPDYYAYFERADGLKVTKFDVERKLNDIKAWLYERVRERAQSRRFNRAR